MWNHDSPLLPQGNGRRTVYEEEEGEKRGTYSAPAVKLGEADPSTEGVSGQSSMCGMQIEESQMLGAFFSNELLEQNHEGTQTLGAKDMTGKQYIENLID